MEQTRPCTWSAIDKEGGHRGSRELGKVLAQPVTLLVSSIKRTSQQSIIAKRGKWQQGWRGELKLLS